jgi:hypothetical protein
VIGSSCFSVIGRKRMKKTAAIAAMAVVTTGGVLAFLALNDLGDTPKVRPEAALPVGESRELPSRLLQQRCRS